MSAFYDLASLVLVPSGYKASKVYAQKPLTTDGQLTFSRASTATRRTASGTVETVAINVPRLDYAFGETCPKLLLEPQRTNLIIQSNDFSAWSLINATATSGQPGYDGTNNAWLLSKSSGFGRAEQNVATSGLETFSVHVKAGTSSYVDITSSEGAFFVGVNLTNGSIVAQAGVTPVITAMGNGWYRISISYSKSATNWVWRIIVGDAGSTSSSAGSVGNILVQAAQAEAGAYPTSYIPTTTAAVTRLADTYQKGGFGNTSTAGTFFCEFEATNINSANGMYLYGMGVGTTDTLGTSYATNANALSIIANGPALQGKNGGYSTTLFTISPAVGATVKIAIRYDGTNVVAFVNGVKQTVYTDSAVGVKNFIRVNNGEQTSHATKQLLFFPTALTDAQAIELTTL